MILKFIEEYNSNPKVMKKEIVKKYELKRFANARKLAENAGFQLLPSVYDPTPRFVESKGDYKANLLKIKQTKMSLIADEINNNTDTVDNISHKYSYKNEKALMVSLNSSGYIKKGGLLVYSQKEKEQKKKVRELKKKEKDKYTKYRMQICRKCHKKFKTEICKRDGMPYNYICPTCHKSNLQFRVD